MNLSPEKSNAQCLVYRKSPRTWSGSAVTILGSILGLALMAFGLLAIEGSDKFMNLWVSGVGFIIFVNSLILGIWMMSDRRLVLDKSSQQLVTSWSVLKLRNSTTQPLSDFIAVRCERKKRAREGASSWVYPVKLQASAPHRSRIIFEESDPARAWQLTTEIGEFLGISQEYWQMTREPGPSEIEVDSSPVNCGAASWCDSQMHSDEHRLVIEPNRGYFRVAWGALAFGGLLIAAAVLAANEPEPGRWGALLVGSGILAAGAAMIALRRRFVFDREAGELWMRPGLRSRTLPLSEVLAVQVISGGTHSGSHGMVWRTHQLNLVLDGERQERVNVSNQPDRAWAVLTGVRLADFLGVPLLGPSPGERLTADRA